MSDAGADTGYTGDARDTGDTGDDASKRAWLAGQVKTFVGRRGDYKAFAQALEEVLERAVARHAPLAIVQTRVKSVASFAEKALRKAAAARRDPAEDFTDLCGARVIARTAAHVDAISEFIEGHFRIDWENTIDVRQRLKPSEFGYRSIHYIVSFERGRFPTADVDLEIPEALLEMPNPRAEVQVRTIFEHGWADTTHDLFYKGDFEMPEVWQREFAALAAMLEQADQAVARIEDGLRIYRTSYGAYMSDEEIRHELDLLDAVSAQDPGNPELASRIGRLAVAVGDWGRAVDALSPHADNGGAGVLRDLGVATCKLNATRPKSRPYRAGQRLLERAVSANPRDLDALCSLAGTWKGIDDEKSRELYARAFQSDPADPYALENYLGSEATATGDLDAVRGLEPAIDEALVRCGRQADAGVNLPWAYFSSGALDLFAGRPYRALWAYAKAVELTTAAFMIETALRTLDRLDAIESKPAGLEWCRRLLKVGLAARFGDEDAGAKALREIRATASGDPAELEAPVVIVAGGCDPSFEPEMRGYRDLMARGFDGFEGTVISGGTRQGVSGLVGGLGAAAKGSLKTVGYLPGMIPSDATLDTRYAVVRRTDGSGFSPLEPLQNWIDIVASGIDPADVKVLGVNGGLIAATEYRLALALGALVGVLEGSGREAARLLADEDWSGSPGLVRLPADPMTLRGFLGLGRVSMDPDVRNALACAIHERHRETRLSRLAESDPAAVSWDDLGEDFRDSSRRQADDIAAKLAHIGYEIRPAGDGPAPSVKLKKGEVELLAEMEHGRWNAERLAAGWRLAAERDPAAKKSPYLVAWSELPEEIREWDRRTVRAIPEFLRSVGLEIRKA